MNDSKMRTMVLKQGPEEGPWVKGLVPQAIVYWDT